MFFRKKTDGTIVEIHKKRAKVYARMALDEEFRKKVEREIAERENPGLYLDRIAKERAEKQETERPIAKRDSNRNIRYSLRTPEHVRAATLLLNERDNKALEEQRQNERRDYLRSVEDCLNMKYISFGEMVKRICEIKEMKSSDVYRTADIDRRLYSKITKDSSYLPGRDTCIALAFGLRLSHEEVGPFLKKAGYAMSETTDRDIILEYCFKNRLHNVCDVNEILDELGEKIL